MKKSTFFWCFIMLVVFPAYLYAQESHEAVIMGSKDIVPAKVKEAVLNDFGASHQPFAWVDNASFFNSEEWIKSTNVEKLEVITYVIRTKTTNGSSLDAVYAADGKLISSREYLKNFRPDRNIMLALQNTEYKDWGLKKTSQLIKVSSTGSEKQRYALVMMKGKEKKTLYIDENNKVLAVVPGEHATLADLDR